MSLLRLVYDDIYEICRNHNNLINWLQEKKILADFQDILCDKCCSGYFHLVKINLILVIKWFTDVLIGSATAKNL